MESPQEGSQGETIAIRIEILDDVIPENQVAEGVLAVLVPADWQLLQASWTADFGDGTLIIDESWTEIVSTQYPLERFNPGMAWTAFHTDTSFSYSTAQTFEATLQFEIGDSLGLYKLACVATRATHDGSGSWTQVEYPHFFGIPRLYDYLSYRVEAADDWTALFYRDSGWTGGDGTYSIPLNGYEYFQEAGDRRTLIHFSDTFLGEVSPEGQRLPGTQLVNNSQSYLIGSLPDEDQIEFLWGSGPGGDEAWIIPQTPLTEEGQWCWQMDGISLEDSVHIFLLRMESDPQASFAIAGVILASGVLDANGYVTNVQQRDMPVEYTDPDDGSQIVFGQAILPQTERSGCPEPDGYIYVYGPRSFSGGKALVAARVLEDSLSHAGAWTFWDGIGWSSDIADCQDIIYEISQEHSVIQTEAGEYILTFLRNGISGPVCIARANTAVGPFSQPEVIWTPPETEISANTFTYNAKAHPHLTPEDELLISYEVNTFSFSEHFQNADIYHPRFIRLIYDHHEATGIREVSNLISPSAYILTAFPNPFNTRIRIKIAAAREAPAYIRIYNVAGELIRTWRQENLARNTDFYWDGRNERGSEVESGIYIIIAVDRSTSKTAMTKVTLLK